MCAARAMRLTRELADLCHRDVPQSAVRYAYDYYEDADYDRAVQKVLSGRPADGIWIFAYGSLIWKPEFETVETRRAVALNWHRGFSLRIEDYRGTPEQPGYMMCLDRGGYCEGVVLRLEEESAEDRLRQLLYREVGSDEALDGVRWIDVTTDEGPLTALAFYAAPVLLADYDAAASADEIAHALARACGSWGSGADYLHRTVAGLEGLGIRDEGLWQLQERVAAEIEAIYGKA